MRLSINCLYLQITHIYQTLSQELTWRTYGSMVHGSCTKLHMQFKSMGCVFNSSKLHMECASSISIEPSKYEMKVTNEFRSADQSWLKTQSSQLLTYHIAAGKHIDGRTINNMYKLKFLIFGSKQRINESQISRQNGSTFLGKSIER